MTAAFLGTLGAGLATACVDLLTDGFHSSMSFLKDKTMAKEEPNPLIEVAVPDITLWPSPWKLPEGEKSLPKATAALLKASRHDPPQSESTALISIGSFPSPMVIGLAVTAGSDKDVLISNLWAEVASQKRRPSGVPCLLPTYGKGSGPTDDYFALDLGVPLAPGARVVCKPTAMDFKPLPELRRRSLKVSKGEKKMLQVLNLSEGYETTWRLHLDWECDGETGSETIDYKGHSFESWTASERSWYWDPYLKVMVPSAQAQEHFMNPDRQA